jgi:hypothetical protein
LFDDDREVSHDAGAAGTSRADVAPAAHGAAAVGGAVE